MPMTSRSTPGVSGPRSTRSPTNSAVRPSGWVAPTARPASSYDSSQPSSVRRVRSSLAQPCTSPTMSKGPVRSRRSFQARSVVIVAASISSTPVSTCTRRNPSLRMPRSDFLRSRCWRATTWAPNCRSARVALRSEATCSGTSSTIASTSTSCSRASLTSAWPGRLLDAGGVDDGEQPAAQPGADDVLQHVEGVLGRGLVVGVVGHQAAAVVAGDDLPGREVLARRRCSCRCRRRRPAPPAPSRAP